MCFHNVKLNGLYDNCDYFLIMDQVINYIQSGKRDYLNSHHFARGININFKHTPD